MSATRIIQPPYQTDILGNRQLFTYLRMKWTSQLKFETGSLILFSNYIIVTASHSSEGFMNSYLSIHVGKHFVHFVNYGVCVVSMRKHKQYQQTLLCLAPKDSEGFGVCRKERKWKKKAEFNEWKKNRLLEAKKKKKEIRSGISIHSSLSFLWSAYRKKIEMKRLLWMLPRRQFQTWCC